MFLSQPNYFNFGLEHQRCAKFYGPSFHQQHDPAMHAKQYHVRLLHGHGVNGKIECQWYQTKISVIIIQKTNHRCVHYCVTMVINCITM